MQNQFFLIIVKINDLMSTTVANGYPRYDNILSTIKANYENFKSDLTRDIQNVRKISWLTLKDGWPFSLIFGGIYTFARKFTVSWVEKGPFHLWNFPHFRVKKFYYKNSTISYKEFAYQFSPFSISISMGNFTMNIHLNFSP